jgi:CDP-diacylglycerol--glycerol-3-phosphate 3-phosphatidyltransferase
MDPAAPGYRPDVSARPTDIGIGPERFWTIATAVTVVRTISSLAICLLAARHEDLQLLVIGLVVYWVGDILDGTLARLLHCETRVGAVVDLLSDRLNCAAFYVGLCWLEPHYTLPVSIYLFEFMVVDAFLSLAFLAWPIRSPNYFFAVDEKIWTWNWSKPGKAVNSALFAVLLLVTESWEAGTVVAVALLALKCLSLRRLLRLGLPVPTASLPSATPVRESAG